MIRASEDPARPVARDGDIGRNVVTALPVALLLPVVGVVALVVRGSVSTPRFSASALYAVFVALFLVVFLGLTHRRRPRAGVPAACHALAWTPFIAAAAAQAVDEGIVRGSGVHCGTATLAFLMLAFPVGGMMLLVAGIGAGALIVRRGTDRALHVVAVSSTALALIAFAFALPRIGRPDPDTYLRSLEVGAKMHEGDVALVAGRTFTYARVPVPDVYPQERADSTSGEATNGEAMLAGTQCELVGAAERMPYFTGSAPCPTLRILLDRPHDIAVVEAHFAGTDGTSVMAFRPSDGEAIGVPVQQVSDRLAPPIGWTLGAGFGGLAGLAFVLAASRARRRAAALDGIDARHAGGGFVELPNGEQLRVDAAASLPIGNVVLGGAERQMPTYRIMGVPTFAAAWPGTLAELRAKSTDLAASLDAIAIATAALGATPLVIARILGGL